MFNCFKKLFMPGIKDCRLKEAFERSDEIDGHIETQGKKNVY